MTALCIRTLEQSIEGQGPCELLQRGAGEEGHDRLHGEGREGLLRLGRVG